LREGSSWSPAWDERQVAPTRALIEQIAGLHDLVTARFDGTDARKPSFVIRRASDRGRVGALCRPADGPRIHLAGARPAVGRRPSAQGRAEVLEQIRALEGDYDFEMYFSLSCHNCPDVVQALTLMALEQPAHHRHPDRRRHLPGGSRARGVMAVPATFLNGEMFASGKMGVEEILAKLDTGADARAAAKLAEKAPFEVLVVGGGPAGAAAAIYTARKGFSTGIAAERFGGQVLDTLGIENFISVPYTEGPKLAAQLEAHVGEYDIDVMNLARAVELVPASEPGGYHEVVLENGAA
jgi:NADH-dependent peroxiredoxin subunit F